MTTNVPYLPQADCFSQRIIILVCPNVRPGHMIKHTRDKRHEVNQKQTSAGLPGADCVAWYLAILGMVSLGSWGVMGALLEIESIGVRIFIMIH